MSIDQLMQEYTGNTGYNSSSRSKPKIDPYFMLLLSNL